MRKTATPKAATKAVRKPRNAACQAQTQTPALAAQLMIKSTQSITGKVTFGKGCIVVGGTVLPLSCVTAIVNNTVFYEKATPVGTVAEVSEKNGALVYKLTNGNVVTAVNAAAIATVMTAVAACASEAEEAEEEAEAEEAAEEEAEEQDASPVVVTPEPEEDDSEEEPEEDDSEDEEEEDDEDEDDEAFSADEDDEEDDSESEEDEDEDEDEDDEEDEDDKDDDEFDF